MSERRCKCGKCRYYEGRGGWTLDVLGGHPYTGIVQCPNGCGRLNEGGTVTPPVGPDAPPEAVAEALAVVLEVWGVPGVGASVADRGKTYNVVDIDARVLVSAGGSRLSGDVWIDRLNEFGMLEAHGCTLAEARALRGVEEGD